MCNRLKINKWNKWIDKIYYEVIHLSLAKHVYNEVQKIIQDNLDIQKESVFYQFMANNYSAFILTGLRRVLAENKDGISLHELSIDIRKNYKIISRSYYKSLYTDDPYNFADRDFDKYSGKEEKIKDYINVKMVENDINEMNRIYYKIKHYIDKKIVHLDRAKPKIIPTYNDIDDSIEYTSKLYKKYYQIIKGANLSSTTPVIQYDWKEIFTEKWIK